MEKSANEENGHFGLSKLVPLNKVLVRQKTTMFSGNKYVVTDSQGGPLLLAKEQGGVLLMGAKTRPFHINIYNTQDQEVMTLRRPYTFGPDKMQVVVGGKLASVVRQEVTFMKPVFNINDPEDQLVLRVKGPAVPTEQRDYQIFTPTKQQVAAIRRVFPGWKNSLTDTDHFHIEFPVDLDVRYKAAVIGTCFLIDFLYFE